MPLLNDEVLGQNTDGPPLHPTFFLKPLAMSLYHPQELATEEPMSHLLLRLCEREADLGLSNFK